MIWNFLVQILIALVLNVISALIMPKPKSAKPEAAKEAENPVAKAGMPVAVVFGTMEKKELNVLGFWDKSTYQYKVSA